MNEKYKIEGTEHFVYKREFLKDENYYPTFQEELREFKKLIKNLVNENKGKTFVHFGDGDYFFLKCSAVGSATPGKRALSKPYSQIDMTRFIEGWKKADFHCVECLEPGMIQKLNELYPNQKTIPTEFLYGLTMNKWFFKKFKGCIGLIGAGPKIKLIQELMKHKEYQEYLGIEKFNDYIEVPQKFACDDLDGTIKIVKEQLEKSDKNTKIFLFGVGHVKSGLIHHLPFFKKAVYVDVGAGIDGIAGIIDNYRPYSLNWKNYRLKNFNYNNIDLLNYSIKNDKNIVFI